MRFSEGTGPVLENLHFRDRLLLENPTRLPDSRWKSMRAVARLRAFNHDLFGGVAIERFRADSTIECVRCDSRWPAFVSEEPGYRVVARHGSPRRYTESLGRDTRTLDRRASAVATTARIEVEKSRSARSECVWEQERTTTNTVTTSAKAGFGPVELSAEAQRKIEDRIKTTVTHSTETTHRTTQTIEVPLPARSTATVTIEWKQVWEEVSYEVALPDGRTTIVPFRQTVEIIFDESVSHA